MKNLIEYRDEISAIFSMTKRRSQNNVSLY